jgi:Rieske Fe-S protein
MKHKRRELLVLSWKVGTGLLAGAGVWTSYEALRPLADVSGSGGEMTLGPPEDYGNRSVTYVRRARLYVTRVKDELFALSQKCPHLGCQVPFCEASGRFECPCHGSRYNLAGEWIDGPSPRGMDRYPIRIVEGRVVVDTAQLEDGAPLGSDEYATPHRGGSCTTQES